MLRPDTLTRMAMWLLTAAAVTGTLAGTAGAQLPAKAEVDAALAAAHAKYQSLQDGKNADYIPALAKVPSNLFGIALVTVDGQVFTVGDVEQRFSIQSISKVFTLALVLQSAGEQAIERLRRCRCHRPGVQLDRGGRAVQGSRDEPLCERGRDCHHQHGARRRPPRRSGPRSSALKATSPAARST